MSWWGKIIGGFFGYLLAGPFGLLLGIIIGNIFDGGLAQNWQNTGFGVNPADQQRTQQAFFKATFTVMGHVAKADGRVSADEIRTAKATRW